MLSTKPDRSLIFMIQHLIGGGQQCTAQRIMCILPRKAQNDIVTHFPSTFRVLWWNRLDRSVPEYLHIDRISTIWIWMLLNCIYIHSVFTQQKTSRMALVYLIGFCTNVRCSRQSENHKMNIITTRHGYIISNVIFVI